MENYRESSFKLSTNTLLIYFALPSLSGYIHPAFQVFTLQLLLCIMSNAHFVYLDYVLKHIQYYDLLQYIKWQSSSKANFQLISVHFQFLETLNQISHVYHVLFYI